MDVAQFWIISVVGPAILLIVLIWLVIKRGSNRRPGDTDGTAAATRQLYAEEEERRREGTDTSEDR
jgi:hypothetical protein